MHMVFQQPSSGGPDSFSHAPPFAGLNTRALGKMEDATVGPVLAQLMDHIIIAAYGKKLMGQLCPCV